MEDQVIVRNWYDQYVNAITAIVSINNIQEIASIEQRERRCWVKDWLSLEEKRIFLLEKLIPYPEDYR